MTQIDKITEIKATNKKGTKNSLKSALTPKEIVLELNKYIIAQKDAKKAVAVALRNRWRRQQLEERMREEVLPKNILMIGPTGVGKTEISRRLARLAGAPFIKVEATKFTELGYVGRDVESIVRDLMDVAINMTKEDMRKSVIAKAELAAEDRVIDALVGEDANDSTKDIFRKKLRDGSLDDKEIEISVKEKPNNTMPTFDIPGMPGAQIGMMGIGDMLGSAFSGSTKKRKMTIKESYSVLIEEEADKLLDEETIIAEAKEAVENNAIVFIDEIDKIASSGEHGRRGDVSREGVQRDLLPLIEGTNVTTKHGIIKTDHILFIASGAFHYAKPSDLLPELQGRLPIRVELRALEEKDFKRILIEPKYSLIKQYIALMATEGIELEFTDDAIDELAKLTVKINTNVENIGARRLHTVLERLLDEISFDAPDMKDKKVKIDKDIVNKRVSDLSKDVDLSKFIL